MLLTPPPPPLPTGKPTPGPLGRFLVDPEGTTRRLVGRLSDLPAQHPRLMLAVTVLLIVGVAGALALGVYRRRALRAGARMVQILAPPSVEAGDASALWDNLHDLLRPGWKRWLLGQPYLSFEYLWSVDGMQIAVWIPAQVPPGFVEHAIEAAWPAARTVTIDAAEAPFATGMRVRGGELRLAQAGWFPLRTEYASDPLRAMIGAVGALHSDERATVQVLVRPATGRAVQRCRRAARQLRAGQPAHRSARVADLLLPGPASTTRPLMDPSVSPDVRAILGKAEGALWNGVVRYGVAAADHPQRRRQIRGALRGRAHALASAFALHSGRNRLRRHRLRRPLRALAVRPFTAGSLLSTSEVAALAHLPTDVAVVGLARAGARAVPPPPAIPRTGDGKLLGDADAGPPRPILMRPSDARYHCHVMGATGAGKSTLLTNLVCQDAEAGRGTVVIDPKGDLVTDILRRLPRSVRDGAVVLDPQAGGRPPTLNMLEVTEGLDADLVTEHLVGIFKNIFASHWGPRTDDVLRSACLTLLRRPGATLSHIPPLLYDAKFRLPYLRDIEDDRAGLGGFWKWYEAQSEAQRAQIIGSPLNKLRAFLLRSFVRSVVDAPKSSIDMGAVLDGGLLLVRVPKGLLGDDSARLLGSFVVAKVWQAATARAVKGEQARVDASLYVDEFQNFLTLPNNLGDMLAEARGYRLSMVLAHQHLGQLPRELKEAVAANARNKLIFTCSPDDARQLAKHTEPELAEHDLSHLGAYQVAAKLIVGGQDQPAFTLRTRPAPEPVGPDSDRLRAAA